MVHLLILLRFELLADDTAAPEAVMHGYAGRVKQNGGRIVAHEADQLLVCVTNMRWGLQSLRNLLAEARRGNFAVRAAIVQAVLTHTDPLQGSVGFTARTLDTLLRLVAHVGRQQVGITPKLLSLIQLSAPEYADLFTSVNEPGAALQGETPPQPVLVMVG